MRLTASGYYGLGNAGDEAVLAGIAEALRSVGGDRAELTVLSQDPESTTRLHGLPAVQRMSMGAVRRAIARTDLLISGGGSLLQDTTSLRSLFYYLWIIQMAHRQSAPVMFYAQGIGPLKRPISRALVRRAANGAAYITVRDEQSRQLLRRIGVSRLIIEVTADPAFGLSPAADEEVDRLLDAERIRLDRPTVALAVRPWRDAAASVQAFARLAEAIERRTGARVVLLPMQSPGDVEFARDIAAAAGRGSAAGSPRLPIVAGGYRPAALLGLVGRMSAVVAMRLHALIFSAAQAVPPFALSYDPKVESLMGGLGLSSYLAPSQGFDPNDVAGRVAELLGRSDALKQDLAARLPDLRRKALRSAEIAVGLASSGP